jgi:hypothetical protein
LGEKTLSELINILNDKLTAAMPSACEVYKSPYFNGLKPDFVLLHPSGAINLIFVEPFQPYKTFEVRFLKKNKIDIISQTANSINTHKLPVWKIDLAHREIGRMYGPRLRTSIYDHNQPPQITLCLLYPNLIFAHQDVQYINTRLRLHGGYILDKSCLTTQSVDPTKFLPQLRYESHPVIEPEAIADLRNWVHQSEASRTQTINYSRKQKRIVENEDGIKRRRIMGGPGSGKTEALLGRAHKLCTQGSEVLYLTYNLTLINDLRNRFAFLQNAQQLKITLINFHEWCRRLSIQFGFETEWAQQFQNADEDQKVFENAGRFILSQLSMHPISADFKYDAIIVDETQDMCVEWVSAALLFLKNNGELLIAADTRQDVYERSSNWTTSKINGLGFGGAWLTLDNSYRTPEYLIPLINDFKRTFLDAVSFEDMPDLTSVSQRAQQLSLGDQLQLEISTDERLADESFEVVHKIIEQDKLALTGRPDRSIEDIVVLVPTKEIGRDLARKILGVGIKVETTFQYPGQRGNLTERDLKVYFSASSGKIKISTIHSFKGMGSSRVVLVINKNRGSRYKSSVYVGLSRLKSGTLGHSLFLVSSNIELNEFFKKYA